MATDTIYARLQVRQPSPDKAATPLISTHSTTTQRAPFRIRGRLSVLDDSIARNAFDTVQLCLRGVIASSIGYKNVLEDIITLTDIKLASDFKPASPSATENDAQTGRHVDFYFELPTSTSTADGIFRPLPLSGVFKGSVNLNQNKTLNDTRLIPGDCEVSYWIEVKFRRAGKLVGFLHNHVQVRSLYPQLRASLGRPAPLTIRAKPDILTRVRFQRSPELFLTVCDPDMTLVESDGQPGKRQISFPLSVAMHAPDSFHHTQSRQSLTCTVEAKWQVHTRFSTLSGRRSLDRVNANETIHKTTTASTQKSTIQFRPLPQYSDNDDQQSMGRNTWAGDPFVVTSQLELPVPDTVSQPSLDWKYLSRTYTLNLTLHFRGIQGAPNYSLQTGIPMSITPYGSKADDALSFISTYEESASQSDEDDSLLDLLGPLGIEQSPPHRQGQRSAARTPPPPYFQ